ncbi:MAG: cell division protein FtsZ [Thermoplasmata archaeon]|nr:cell division protein FtsZ [Thermoplasmata archaeon]
MKSIIDEALARHDEHKKAHEISKAVGIYNESPDDEELKKLVEALKINVKIVGCGGGGSNTVNRLNETGVVGAQMMAVNTDATHLLHIHAPKKMLIGKRATKGLGAGALPEVGEQACREKEDEIRADPEGAHIVFVTAGMGGGTGTGSAAVVAELAKEAGALVMGIVTMPFKAEGHMRMENAIKGLNKLRIKCDTTIVIQNDKLLELVPKLPLDAAFKVADEILMNAIKGMTEIVTKPGLVNLDYSDLMTVMENGGVAMVGIGSSSDDRERVEMAVNEALNSPLLGDIDISQSKGALIRVVGGEDLTIAEAQQAAELVTSRISPSARIIWGCTVDPTIHGDVHLLVVITGVKSPQLMGADERQGAGIAMVR